MKRIFYSCIGIAMLLTACEREVSFEPPTVSPAIPEVPVVKEPQTSVNDFLEKNKVAAQSFSVNSTAGTTIITSGGSKIHFPSAGFVTGDGVPVTGDVLVKVKEIYTPADMILNNMPTMAGGAPLESAGEYEIVVTKNGKVLKLAPGNFLRIELPSINRPSLLSNMQVFNGKKDANGNVDWAVNNNPGNLVVKDSLFSKASLFADSVNWINCDKYFNEPMVTYSVYPNNAPSNDSTTVFIHLTGRNTVVKMYWTQGLNYFNSDKLLPLPSTIIGISVRNGQLYASFNPVIVKNNGSVTMNFAPYTEADLKKKLAELK